MNTQPRRSTLAFLTRHRAHPDRPVLRLFKFDARQAAWFERAVAGLQADGGSAVEASNTVEQIVLAYLMGREPGGSLLLTLRLGRSLFPVLSDADVEQLPRSGAPVGRIAACVIVLTTGPGHPMVPMFCQFTNEQADAFNMALHTLTAEGKMARDDAWHVLVEAAGKFLVAPPEKIDPALAGMAEVFQPADAEKLRVATEEDFVRWAFTTAPLLLPVSS